MDPTNQELTYMPNYILLDDRLSMGAKLAWQIFAMQQNSENDIHNLDVVAQILDKHIETIRKYILELVEFNYLNRTPKNNGEFGYIYSIPEEHIPVKKTSL